MYRTLLQLKPRDVPAIVALRNTAAVALPLAIGVATQHVDIGVGISVGALTCTGSVVAWAKLRGSISGKPLLLPGRQDRKSVV